MSDRPISQIQVCRASFYNAAQKAAAWPPVDWLLPPGPIRCRRIRTRNRPGTSRLKAYESEAVSDLRFHTAMDTSGVGVVT
jgi:hypothetical protein